MKRLFVFTLIFSVIYSCNVRAQDSVLLNQGDPAPFPGFLLPPEKIKELRNDSIDLNYYKKANENLNLQIVDYDKRVNLYIQQNDKLSERLAKSETGFFERVGFFILGAAITGLIGFGVYKSR